MKSRSGPLFTTLLTVLLGAGGLEAAGAAAAPPATGPGGAVIGSKTLEFCHLPDYRQEVLCGSHVVFENRAAAEGRRIEIRFAVMPAVGEDPESDPLVVFAGGPGQAAMEMAPFVEQSFQQVRERRDIVLIDQRGMGRSHPLDCEMPEDEMAVSPRALAERAREAVTACLEAWDADVTLYTQDLANEDIHEILLALDYSRVNLFGGSWGTRSALFYAHRYPEHVRSIVLDGALPPENAAPLHAAADGDRALRALFAACAGDAACHQAFPALEGDFRRVVERLGTGETEITFDDPVTGEPTAVVMTRDAFGGLLRGVLYSPELSRVVPYAVHRAAAGDFKALLGVSSYLATASEDVMTPGASLAIFCAEEIRRGPRPDAVEAAAGDLETLIGTAMLDGLQNACGVWPETSVPAIYAEEAGSQAPALILSGEVDPITPPRWGEAMSRVLPRSLHVVAPNTGHNVAPVGCAPELIADFVERGGFEGLDAECLEEIERPSFFVSAAGPAMSGPAPAQQEDAP